MTHMTSLTQILFVNFASKTILVLSLNCNRQDNIKLIDHQSTWFGVYNNCMTGITLAHAPMNHYVSQFGH